MSQAPALPENLTDPVVGLTAADVAERVARGQANDAPDARSRSLGDIVRANTFTWFNGLIGSLWLVMLLVAPIQDSLFGFVIVANTGIGIIQEWRASRTLAKLAVIGEAKPVVRRDGADVEVSPGDVVLDDLIVLRTGDQLVVDGVVVEADGLEIDESLLTGEADPVDMVEGAPAMSGSFVVAGSGLYQATRVGKDSFAAGLTEQAKKFHLTNSELRDAINSFIRVVSFLLIPVGLLLLWSQLVRADLPVDEAIRGTIAGVVTMVPEGLVLLTSIAMAVSVIRLAQKRVLVQDMPAVEVLARVDTICVDKTGTLTEPGMKVRDVVTVGDPASLGGTTADGADRLAAVLGALGASESNPNPTLEAISEHYPSPGWTVTGSVPFSSARKWSAATFEGQGTWLLGAPEMLIADGDAVRGRADELAADGARVLLLAKADATPTADEGPGAVEPVALVVINQQLRPDAAETVAYFLAQDVTVKVISGDNATTVGAIAMQAGVPGADKPVDARGLPTDPAELAEVVMASNVFGRVTPAQKQEMVDALHLKQSTVAMTGDGVNDVLALKNADLGIAMGSGSGATRAVAQLVLLDNRWSVMPSVVAEGRRVLGNIERVSDVFLTKSFYAMIISIVVGITAITFPFLPRHLSLIGALTIGIPGFFLALMPNTERFRPGFLRRVLLFAAPSGVIAAVAALTSFQLALNAGEPLLSAQSSATTTLFIVTTAVLLQSARPLNALRLAIVVAMVVAFLGVLFIPWFSNFFALSLGPEKYAVIAIGVGFAGALLVWVATIITDRWRRA
ncbi:MAG: cation-transporting P-type ATPase [Actinomycetota bacterium]|jgi:cation-transporting ATPase E|nr:cation-transporting P-type ATPase [Actinomycetota bacterium]